MREYDPTINGKYSRGHLTKAARNELFSTLSDEQQTVLNQYKQYKIDSMLLNQFNETGTEWMFIKEEINPDYNDSKRNESYLKCSCGRGVKYLYTCKSKNTGEIQAFGRPHLEKEAKIGADVLKDIRDGRHEIDRGLDEILIRMRSGSSFPTEEYTYLKDNGPFWMKTVN